ncbi:hypothetical protein [Pseudonocardia sp. McavD-2-B]|nr:hypothetical protein [Pseudonocardia sp. McavD-2-B]
MSNRVEMCHVNDRAAGIVQGSITEQGRTACPDAANGPEVW